MGAVKGTRPPNAGKGRPKGVPNKATAGARAAFQMAFDGLGGAKSLQQWAADNPTEFYRLYARLIPVPVEHAGDVRIEVGWQS